MKGVSKRVGRVGKAVQVRREREQRGWEIRRAGREGNARVRIQEVSQPEVIHQSG